jgi:hypothetical protein
MAHNIQQAGDAVDPSSLPPPGSEEYLAFMVFRLVPAAAVLCGLMTCEWLFYRLHFSEKQ